MPAKMPVSLGKAPDDPVAQGSTSMADRLSRPMPHNNPFQRIRHIPGQDVTYLQNPKVACTSIELTLWGAHAGPETPENPHVAKVRPYMRKVGEASSKDIESLLASTFFSVVRNPYARFLSAYYDKVGARKRPWERIGGSLGFAKDTTPSPSELLIALQSRDPVDVDHHFRPQHLNLLCGFAPLDFLGYMEQMDSVTAFLAKHSYALVRYTGNATGAAAKVSMLSSRDAALIRHYYAKDFELFGYDDDPGRKEPVRETTTLNPKRGHLRRYIMRRRARLEKADSRRRG